MKAVVCREELRAICSLTQADLGNTSSLVSEIICLLRQRGYLINRKRLAFVTVICAMELIEGPEELWTFLQEQNTPISITSVYNNLRLMVKENLLIKTEQANGRGYMLRAGYYNSLKKVRNGN